MPKRKTKKPPSSLTITSSELSRLAFRNAKELPPRVWAYGNLIEWNGVNWIVVDKSHADGTEPTVVDD